MINDILFHDAHARHGFQGAFPWTQIPDLAPGQSCIANTHCEYKVSSMRFLVRFSIRYFIVRNWHYQIYPQLCFQKGEHWLALIHIDSNLEFFDSFGWMPEMYEGIPYKVDIVNEKQVQSLDAQTCGLWAVYFLLQRYRGFTMNEIVQPLNDVSVNDVVIAKYFSDIYKIDIPVYL